MTVGPRRPYQTAAGYLLHEFGTIPNVGERIAAQGWEFEIPDYKYAALFSPLEDLLAKPPEPAKKAGTAPPPNPAVIAK